MTASIGFTNADLDLIWKGALPVPTDEERLAALLGIVNPTRWHEIDNLLQRQTDSNPDLVDLFERVAADVSDWQHIIRLRAKLRLQLTATQDAARDVLKTLDALSGPEVFDVEYAEGGSDMRHFLEDAARLLRAAGRANPVRED